VLIPHSLRQHLSLPLRQTRAVPTMRRSPRPSGEMPAGGDD